MSACPSRAPPCVVAGSSAGSASMTNGARRDGQPGGENRCPSPPPPFVFRQTHRPPEEGEVMQYALLLYGNGWARGGASAEDWRSCNAGIGAVLAGQNVAGDGRLQPVGT